MQGATTTLSLRLAIPGGASMAVHALRAILVLALVATVPRPARAQTRKQDSHRDTTSDVSAVLSDHGTGEPIAGALVHLFTGVGRQETFRTRVTNAYGRFFFTGIPAGRYLLTVSRLGYQDLTDSVSFPGGRVDMRLQLSSAPVQIAPIIVRAEPRRMAPGPVPGLEERERRGLGTILTRKQIENDHAFSVSGLLRMVPGVRLVPNDEYGYDIRLRGGCKPAIWVDGSREGDVQDLDLMLRPSDLQAVEVYQASEVPVQFAGSNSCGAVLFWTRPAEGGLKIGSWWKKLIIPAAILIGAIIKLH